MKALRSFAWLTSVGLFLVLIFGFVVTDTGSGRGCGGSWPLCHGKFIPAFAFHTLIEFGHRSLAAIVGLMVFALFLWAWRQAGHRPFVKVLASLGLLFVIVQAAIGAADVLHPESAPVLAFHFGFSLVAFAAVSLLAIVLGQDAAGLVSAPPDGPDPRAIRMLAIATFIAIYGVAYLGAYVSHLEISRACAGWPLCNGAIVPTLGGPTGIVFLHRTSALVVLLLALLLHRAARPFRAVRRDLTRATHALLGAVGLQIFSGAYLVFASFDLPSLLVHVAVMSILFTSASYLFLHALLGFRTDRAVADV